MYNDIGKKIQGIGQILGWLSLIVGIITWLILITNGYDTLYGYRFTTEDDIIGWFTLVTGVLGYISSWFTYGLGQLIDDIHALRNHQVQPGNSANDALPEL